MSFANAGFPVSVLESNEELLDRGMEKIRGLYTSSVSKGRLSQADMDERMGHPPRNARSFRARRRGPHRRSRLRRDGRQERHLSPPRRNLQRRHHPRDEHLDARRQRDRRRYQSAPELVIGTHFFSPANIMKLMENVRGEKTSKETIATIMKLSKQLGKVGVLVGVCDGFVGNRMLYAYRQQADFLLEEGALPRQVDKALFEFGLPMGPFAMMDLAGLDIGWAIRKRQAPTRPKELRYSPIPDRICEMGRYGQKTGAGWYRYEKGSRTPIPDPEIEALVVEVSKELGFERRAISDEEIVERCMFPLINEGAKILEEGNSAPAGGYRHRLDLRLRFSALSRRPDVLCGHGGRRQDPRDDGAPLRRTR